MNWDSIEGKWEQASGMARAKWGKLTHEDLVGVAGNRDQLIGKLQERYGLAKDQVEKQLADFERGFLDPQPAYKRRALARR